MKLRYQYPGDPIDTVEILTGRQFKEANPDREIRISISGKPDTVIPVDEVVCDLCNASVGDEDLCGVTDQGTRLYCRACIQRYLEPYFLL